MMKTDYQPRMIRMKNLTKYCDLSRAHIYQLIKEGAFPEGHRLSIGVRAWQISEVDSWIDEKMGRGV